MACGLEDLPDDVLTALIGRLEPQDLAALAVQSSRLRRLVAVEDVWERHSRARWPRCGLRNSHHSWQALYRARALLDPIFCTDVDKLLQTTEAARCSVCSTAGRQLFERAMPALLSVGLAASREPSLKQAPDYKAVVEAAIIAFASETNSQLQEFDIWTSRFVNYERGPWRRSALEYLKGMLGGMAAWQAQGVLPALEAELARLDRTFRSIEEEAGDLSLPQPLGLPPSHWWFRMSGVHVRRIC